MGIASKSLMFRLAGFAGIPFLSLLTPFLLLPILARITTPDGWASIAIGQSVGGVGALIVSYGWNLLGPVQVARKPVAERPSIYLESLISRSFLLAVFLGPLVFVSWILAPEGVQNYSVLMTIAVAFSGLSAVWYNIGTGKPRDIAIYDAFPKLLGTLAASMCLIVTEWVAVYPIALFLSTVVGLFIFSRKTLHGNRMRTKIELSSIVRVLRRGLAPAATDVAAGAYSTSAISLISVTADSQQVGLYAASDRIYRVGLFALTALGNGLIAWVVEAPNRGANRRLAWAGISFATLGLLGFVVLWLLLPSATTILFGADLAAEHLMSVGFGLSYIAVSMNTFMGRFVLIPAGRTRAVLLSTIVGAGVGVPSILIFANLWGAAGTAFALALSQIVVCFVQLPICIRVRLVSRPTL